MHHEFEETTIRFDVPYHSQTSFEFCRMANTNARIIEMLMTTKFENDNQKIPGSEGAGSRCLSILVTVFLKIHDLKKC